MNGEGTYSTYFPRPFAPDSVFVPSPCVGLRTGNGSNAAIARVEKGAAGPGGEPAAHEPGLGTGRGGDVTGVANYLLVFDPVQAERYLR